MCVHWWCCYCLYSHPCVLLLSPFNSVKSGIIQDQAWGLIEDQYFLNESRKRHLLTKPLGEFNTCLIQDKFKKYWYPKKTSDGFIVTPKQCYVCKCDAYEFNSVSLSHLFEIIVMWFVLKSKIWCFIWKQILY